MRKSRLSDPFFRLFFRVRGHICQYMSIEIFSFLCWTNSLPYSYILSYSYPKPYFHLLLLDRHSSLRNLFQKSMITYTEEGGQSCTSRLSFDSVYNADAHPRQLYVSAAANHTVTPRRNVFLCSSLIPFFCRKKCPKKKPKGQEIMPEILDVPSLQSLLIIVTQMKRKEGST